MYFDPRAISSYSATLDAVVREGADQDGSSLRSSRRRHAAASRSRNRRISPRRTVSLVKFKDAPGAQDDQPTSFATTASSAVLRAEMMTHKHFSIEGGGVTTTLSPDAANPARHLRRVNRGRAQRPTRGEAKRVRDADGQVRRGWLRDDVMFADLPRDLDDGSGPTTDPSASPNP